MEGMSLCSLLFIIWQWIMVRLLRFVPIMKISRLKIIRVTTRLLRFQRRARPRSPSPLRSGTFLLRGSRGRAVASETLRN